MTCYWRIWIDTELGARELTITTESQNLLKELPVLTEDELGGMLRVELDNLVGFDLINC